jgi:hypothetical protein
MRTDPFFAGILLLATSACDPDNSGAVKAQDPFCFSMDDADAYELEPLDDDPASGSIWGRMITDESRDLRDPQYVAFVEYTLENLDVGGSPQQGETDVEGAFEERVGAGRWLLTHSADRVGFDCTNSVELVVEAGQKTIACIDVGCVE